MESKSMKKKLLPYFVLLIRIREDPRKSVASLAFDLPLDQLQQHAPRARRMHKHILVPARPGLDLLRDQAHAVFLQPLDSRG